MATKHFKLGKKSSSFVDPLTKKKIAPGQVIEFTDADRKSKRFREAVEGKHIVEASDSEAKNQKAAVGSSPGESYEGLVAKKDKVTFITKAFALNATEKKALEKLSIEKIDAKYAELLAGTKVPEDDEDEDEDEDEDDETQDDEDEDDEE